MKKLRKNLNIEILVVTACTTSYDIKNICSYATWYSCVCRVILTMEIENFPEQFR
jgi:hypothetical protein